jgi:hypothetical protein
MVESFRQNGRTSWPLGRRRFGDAIWGVRRYISRRRAGKRRLGAADIARDAASTGRRLSTS